jgi:isoleucyl-tRNA synthetase/protein-tyrosine-phosphatase
MPVWKGDKGSIKVVGSYAELEELSGQKLDDYHRPWVDEVTFTQNGENFTRIEEVLDGWFESGSMPFAQLHYPFENKAKFDANYPADFIVEYVAQVRAWFYYVHVVNTALADIGAFGEGKSTARSKLKKIVFVCHANVNRSQMAKAVYNMLTGTNDAKSAGAGVHSEQPEGDTIAKRNTIVAEELGIDRYRPGAQIILLDRHDIDITDWPRTQLTPEMLKDYDLVVNIAEKFQTPDWLRGDNVIWWNIKDPGLVKGDDAKVKAANAVLDEITERVKKLIELKRTEGNFHKLDDKIDGDAEHIARSSVAKYAFKNVIVTGTIAGEDGRKMSKSLGNFTDPNELMDRFSADSLRFLLLSSPLLSGEDFSLKDKDVGDAARKLAMIWNMYDFFTMYAEVDNWEWNGEHVKLENLKNPLDIWIVSRLHQLGAEITKNMDNYNIPDAMSGILPFVDDASNWFVRRSRRRFWKSEDDADKGDAYRTLHYVLVYLAQLLAPFTPFLAEELYQKLTGEESVHLLNWPTNITVNQKVLDEMARTREIIEKGLALRMDREDEFGQIKVRQPLAKLTYAGERLSDFYEQIIADEVNVKAVDHGEELVLDKDITPELKREGQAREIIRVIQNARKAAGLNVDDRIVVNFTTSDGDLNDAINEYHDTIATEILATEFADNDGYQVSAKIDGVEITVQLSKEERK